MLGGPSIATVSILSSNNWIYANAVERTDSSCVLWASDVSDNECENGLQFTVLKDELLKFKRSKLVYLLKMVKQIGVGGRGMGENVVCTVLVII